MERISIELHPTDITEEDRKLICISDSCFSTEKATVWIDPLDGTDAFIEGDLARHDSAFRFFSIY